LNCIRKTAIAVCCMLMAVVLCYAENISTNADIRDKLLGDNAFRDGEYSLAVKCYKRYFDKLGPDSSAWIDAAVLLGSAYVMDDRIAEARQLYKLITSKLKKNDDIRIRLLDSEILTAEKEYKKAQAAVEGIIHGMIAEGEDYSRTLALLGLILTRQKLWDAAANIYAMLERAGVDTPWEYRGFCLRIFSLINAKKYSEASKLLESNGRLINTPGKDDARILNLLLLIKQQNYKEFVNAYAQLKIEPKPNRFMEEVLSDAVKYYSDAGDEKTAAKYLSDSYVYATSGADGKKILLSLINLYSKSDDLNAAVDACKRYIKFYSSDKDVFLMKLKMAELLVRMKKYPEAVEIYEGIMNDETISFTARMDAAVNAGNILAEMKKYDEAEKVFSFIVAKGQDKDIRANGLILRGKVYLMQKSFIKALDIFRDASEMSEKFKPVAQYWMMRTYYDMNDYKAVLGKINLIASTGVGDNQWLEQDILYYRALVLSKTGDSTGAYENFLACSTRFPEGIHAEEALFLAGDIAISEQRFNDAAKIYSDFIKRFPHSKDVPEVCYKRIYALFCAGKDNDASDGVYVLAGKFPDSSYTIAAFFWLVDLYRDQGNIKKALDTLEDICKRYKNDKDTVSQALTEQAYLAFQQGKDKSAEELLIQVIKTFPASAGVPRAFFLLGNISSDAGKFTEAVDYYKNCIKSKPDYELENACRGRLGDCYFSLYNMQKDPKILDLAIEEFSSLQKRKISTFTVRNQTLYKLAKCYEQKHERKKALELYKELIYGYKVDSSMQSADVKPVWVYKAAKSAVDIYMAEGSRKAAMSAIRIYRLMQELKLDSGLDYDRIIEEIKKKYKL